MYYQVCIECQTSWYTENDLLEDWVDYFVEQRPEEDHPQLLRKRGNEIMFCPLCLHDFPFPVNMEAVNE